MKTILITHGWQYRFPAKPLSDLGLRLCYFADSYLPFTIVENKAGEPALAFDGKPILKNGKAAIPSLAAYEGDAGELKPTYLTDPEHLVAIDDIVAHVPYLRPKKFEEQTQFLRFLAHYNVPGVESYKALRVSADKVASYRLFRTSGVSVPDSIVIDPAKQDSDEIYKVALGFYMRCAGRVLLKQSVSSHGRGIYLPKSTQDLKVHLVELSADNVPFLVQKKIMIDPPLHHIRVAMSFGEIIGVHKFIAAAGQKISNASSDSFFSTFELTPEQEATCMRAVQALGIQVCSFDCLISSEGDFYILEANSMPSINRIFPEQAQRISEDIAAYIEQL